MAGGADPLQSRATRWGWRIGAAVLVVGVALVVLWALQRQLMYFPAGEPPPVSDVLPGAEAITYPTPDGLMLSAWFLEGGPVAVLVLPGNAGNRAARAPLAAALAERGLGVLLVDYRGYGGNPGSPSESGLLSDARGAHAWLARRSGIEEVVLYGESIGTGVATRLAKETDPGALILRSPFPSLAAVARQHYGPVPDWLLRDRYETIQHIRDVDAPTLVVAGGEDGIIPAGLSRQVHAAVPGPSRFELIEGASHNDRALLNGERLIGAVVDFLRQHHVIGRSS